MGRKRGSWSWRRKPMSGLAIALACTLVAVSFGAVRPHGWLNGEGGVSPKVTTATSSRANGAGRVGADSVRVTLGDYDVVTQRNLFMPAVLHDGPGASAVQQAALLATKLPASLKHDETEATAQAQAASSWIYAGYATVDGNPTAIIENRSTKRAVYLSAGQTLDGAAVISISPQVVRLASGGGVAELPISEVFNATPFDAPAGTTSQATGGSAVQTGGWAGGPGGRTGGRGVQTASGASSAAGASTSDASGASGDDAGGFGPPDMMGGPPPGMGGPPF